MENKSIPRHIAFIMDGNGRWAKAKNLPRNKGHEAGAKAVQRVIEYANAKGIEYITLYAFSTENWTRPQSEIDALMDLLCKTLKKYKKSSKANGYRILVSGRKAPLTQKIIDQIEDVVKETAKNKAITINLALNYGGRQEITDAVNNLISQGKTQITEADISASLYNPDIPEPDLIIRTSGEKRLSNFLLWQSAYTEFYFTSLLWPDFAEADFEKALEEYSTRQRRYGSV